MSEQFNEFGPFAVGDICRIVRIENHPELIGTEVKIVSGPCVVRDPIDGSEWVGYITDLRHKGYVMAPEENQLRRRKPPASHTGERMFMQQLRDLADRLRESEPA